MGFVMRGLVMWPAGVGVIVVFDDADAELWDRTVAAWASLEPTVVDNAATVKDADRVVVLTRRTLSEVSALFEGKKVSAVKCEDLGYAAERLTVEVTLHVLQALVGEAHLLHAAVLGDEESGAAVALVAASGTGKTTASRFLGRSLTYLTDETAVVLPDLRVRPYAKPLSVIEDSARYKVQYDPASLGMRVAAPDDESFRLRAVLVLNRVKDMYVEPVLERLPLGEALVQVVGQSSGTQMQERGLLRVAELLNAVGGALRLTYSEVDETLPLVQAVLAGKDGVPQIQEELKFVAATEPENEATSGVLRRATGTEGLVTGERVLISTQGRLTEVSIFAWDCWELLAKPKSLEALYEALVELYGEVPRPEFESVLEQLKGARIIC